MARGITLTRSDEAAAPYANRGDGHRMVITALDGELLDDQIFLFQRYVADAATGQYAEEFAAIASPEDLTAYPADTPNVLQTPGFYRKAVVDAIYDTPGQAAQAWAEVKSRVAELVAALNRKDELAVPEVVTCGDCSEDTSDTSESSATVSAAASETTSESSVSI